MNTCWACLRPVADESRYHTKCLWDLFGMAKLPEIDVELAKLHTLALAMVGHTSLSGIQRKISLDLAGDKRTLRVAIGRGRYILKPQAQTFPFLPENEHATMRLADRTGIEVPPCALVELKDGSRAYIVGRFDRSDTGKLLQEDFCQLAVKSPKDKYEGSAELCARLVHRYATAPLIEAQKLFRLIAFCWWTGNGDMHLKNFSLLRHVDGAYRVSPAYDLLCTRLAIPDDQLALSIGGTKAHVGRKKWFAFAEACKLPTPAAERVLAEIGAAVAGAPEVIDASLLPDDMKGTYGDLVRDRGRVFTRGEG